jgi:hypothetical protein
MEITINGQMACLKKNTSFEYISENSMFTGSDSYTLTITFPLKDCPQNIRIFGHIHRQDVEKNKVVFDCEIRDKAFYKAGSIVVTQISEVEVKTQFLEGRSKQNFDDTFDDVYLNQLSLGYPDADTRNPANTPPNEIWVPDSDNPTYVALPWVNNTTGNLQNGATFDGESANTYSWMNARVQLSFQPYLIYILKKICQVMGYTGDFGPLEAVPYKYLLICNCLPSAWGAFNFAIALPHWSLTEFFEQLEYFLAGEFSINHKAKTITFRFISTIAQSVTEVKIDNVVNKYTVEVSSDNRPDYLGTKNLVYAENDNRYWAYRDCQWYIDEHKDEAIVYDSFFDLLEYARQNLATCGYYRTETAHGYRESYMRGYPNASDGHKLFYARDLDTYFIMWCYKAELVKSHEMGGTTYNWYQYYNRLEPINQFGKYIVDKDAEDIELKCVPAWIDDTDEELGPCLFLECGEMGSAVSWTDETDEEGNTTGSGTGIGGGSFGGGRRAPARAGSFGGSRPGGSTEVDDTDYNDGALAQPRTAKAIAKGEQEKDDAYFDCLYMGYQDWEWSRQYGYLKHPCIDQLQRERGFIFSYSYYTMRLKDIGIAQSGLVKNIDPKKKYNFSFLADEIPDPRATFYIDGGKYICEKITATFHESTGKSQLLKGVFYRIV